MSEKPRKAVVSSADFVDLKKDNLPYLKSIDLIKLAPKHLGLNDWKPNISLPDSWMRKIYRYDHLSDDSDASIDSTPEELNSYQKKVLYDHLTQIYAQERSLPTRRNHQAQPTRDCLRELLDESLGDETNDSSSDPSSQKLSTRHVLDKIETCNKHKFSSEQEIVRLVLDKMKNLSAEDEKKCKKLFRDSEFMDYLNNQVEAFLKRSTK